MNITLFDAAQSVREALATVDPETGEYTDEYTTSRELFERKGGACVAYALEEAASIEAAEKLLKAKALIYSRIRSVIQTPAPAIRSLTYSRIRSGNQTPPALHWFAHEP